MAGSDAVQRPGRGDDEQLEDPNFNPWLSPSKLKEQRRIAEKLKREGPPEIGNSENTEREPEDYARDNRDGLEDMEAPRRQNDLDQPDHEHAMTENRNHEAGQKGQRERREERKEEQTVDLAPKYRREIWRERQREACEANGLEECRTGRMRGKVEDVEEIGDQKTVVVTNDEGEFSLVDVDRSADLDVGDDVKVDQGRSQTAEPDIEKHEPDRSRGFER